jgi:hypothetical protein
MVFVGKKEYKYGRMLMSHMASPDLELLHQMADAIGVSRKWFQNKERHPHYDLCKAKKQLAISLGAVEVDDRELIRECYLKQEQ